MKSSEIRPFIIGLLIGSSVILVPYYFYNKERKELTSESHRKVYEKHREFEEANQGVYNESLSHFLYDNVKLLCMVMTYPKNHRTKAMNVKNTWGRRCNKLVFISSAEDQVLDTVVALPLKESRKILWTKTKAGFLHLYDNYLNDYDFFIKADDDK